MPSCRIGEELIPLELDFFLSFAFAFPSLALPKLNLEERGKMRWLKGLVLLAAVCGGDP